MANNNFIKVDDMIININSIDGIFRACNRWIVQLNGKDVYVDDITPIMKAINLTDTEATPFDPDKRITPTTDTSDETTRFMKAAALIRGVVTEHNREYTPSSEVSIEVNKDKRSITITRGHYSTIRIVDGLIIEDSIANVETYADMKRKINDILIGVWIK